MAPSILSSEFEVSLGDGSVTVAVPAGTANGHILIGLYNGDGVASLPSGWIAGPRRNGGFADGSCIAWFWRIANSEPANYTFTGAGSPTYAVGSILNISDADPFGPFRASYTYASATSSTRTNPGVLTDKDDTLVLIYTDGAAAYTMPDGWALADGTGATNIAVHSEPNAGNQTAFSATMGSSQFWETYTVGIRAADPPGTTYETPDVVDNKWSVSGGSSTIVDVPASVVDGDVLIAFSNSDLPLSTPIGWTSAGLDFNNAGNPDISWFWRIANSEPSSYTFGAAGGGYVLAGIMKVTGVSGVEPFILSAAGDTGTNLSGGRLNPGIYATQPKVLLLCYSDGTSNTTTPDGWAFETGATGSNVISKVAGVAGPTGALEIVQVTAGFYFTHMVGLRPKSISPSNSFNLVADTGSYVATPVDVALKRSLKISGDGASFSLTGESLSLRVSRALNADPASYTESGINAALIVARQMIASNVAYAMTGRSATLRVTGSSFHPEIETKSPLTAVIDQQNLAAVFTSNTYNITIPQRNLTATQKVVNFVSVIINNAKTIIL